MIVSLEVLGVGQGVAAAVVFGGVHEAAIFFCSSLIVPAGLQQASCSLRLATPAALAAASEWATSPW